MTTIITTGGRPDEISRKLAVEASETLGYQVVERKKRSITKLQQAYKANILVAGSNRFDLYYEGMEKPFFFHPNSAAFRLKRLLKGETDPLIEAAGLQAGDTFLDCTLGLASDSIIASFITGEQGRVMGIEANPDIAFITGRGLHSFQSDCGALTEAMERIQICNGEAISVLKGLPKCSWDVVYIDPMFSAPINESLNFTPLRQVGFHDSLSTEWVEQAIRVSRRSVVVKDVFDSSVFEKFGMQRQIRPNIKFHFGAIFK